MKIKKFEEFNNKDILYIFDFDDTLVESPSFEELAIDYLSENISIEDLLRQSVNRVGKKVSDLQWENGRIFIQDPDRKIIEFGNWVRKGQRVYMTSPNAFNTADISLPNRLKSLSDLYRQVENKCIVTAREEIIREKILSKMSELGLDMPKYGLHMAPSGQKNLGTWKGHKIVEIIKRTNFNKAIFYDDNPKYIKNATKVVKEKLPNLEFTTVKIN